MPTFTSRSLESLKYFLYALLLFDAPGLVARSGIQALQTYNLSLFIGAVLLQRVPFKLVVPLVNAQLVCMGKIGE